MKVEEGANGPENRASSGRKWVGRHRDDDSPATEYDR